MVYGLLAPELKSRSKRYVRPSSSENTIGVIVNQILTMEKVHRIEIVFVLLTVFFASFLGHFAGDDLADVLDGELSLLDGVFRLHPPPASVSVR